MENLETRTELEKKLISASCRGNNDLGFLMEACEFIRRKVSHKYPKAQVDYIHGYDGYLGARLFIPQKHSIFSPSFWRRKSIPHSYEAMLEIQDTDTTLVNGRLYSQTLEDVEYDQHFEIPVEDEDLYKACEEVIRLTHKKDYKITSQRSKDGKAQIIY